MERGREGIGRMGSSASQVPVHSALQSLPAINQYSANINIYIFVKPTEEKKRGGEDNVNQMN